MKTLLVAAAFSVCCALPAAAGTLEEVTPYFSTQYFTWEEHDGGRRILKERGALLSLGGVLGAVTESSVTLRGKAELFGGEVGYSGETQAPNRVPLRTEVGYFGTKAELDLGYRMESASVRFEPFGGIGHRWWFRDLQDSTTVLGGPASGYTEIWQTVYGRLGARGHLMLPRGIKVVAEGGAKYPFYTGNTVDFVNRGTTTLRPGALLSWFAETGVSRGKMRLALLYEGFRFSRSPMKNYFLQPRSSSDIFGVSLGWSFR